MGTDSNDVSAQEDQDISTHLERGGREKPSCLRIQRREDDSAHPVR